MITTQTDHPGAPAGLWNYRFVSLMAVTFLAAAFTASLTPLLPAYVEEQLQRPPRFTGFLAAMPMFVAGFLFLVGGALADRFGYKRILLLGLAGSGFNGLVFLFASSPLLIGISIFIGAGFALQAVGLQSYLLRATKSSRLGMGSAVFFMGCTLGGALGNLLFGPVADAWGYRAMGSMMVVGMGGVTVASLVLLPEIPLPSLSGQARTLRSSFVGYGDLLSRTQVRWLLGVRFLAAFTWGTATFAFPYLLFVHTQVKRQPAFYAAASLAVAACAQILTGRLCDRFSVHWPVRIASVGLLLSCLCTAIWADSIVGLWIFGIAMTASAWSLSTTMPALMHLVSTEHEKGKIVGATHLAWALGMASGQMSSGRLLESGASACYWVGLIFAIATVICVWRMVRDLSSCVQP